jgi:hypothetical protein
MKTVVSHPKEHDLQLISDQGGGRFIFLPCCTEFAVIEM